jgi:hypothetical protein
MKIGVKDYDISFFNATPDLPRALAKHAQVGGDDEIGKFGPVFAKHSVEKLIGMTLIHHHFDLEPGEYLTEVAGTSTAWKSRTGTIPHVWALDSAEKVLVPLEFVMMDNPAPINWDDPVMQAFLEDFIETSKATKSAGVYGLTTYPGDDFPGRVEMTVGRANVNLTPTQVSRKLLHLGVPY